MVWVPKDMAPDWGDPGTRVEGFGCLLYKVTLIEKH